MVLTTLVHNTFDQIIYSKISTETPFDIVNPFYCKWLDVDLLYFYGFANDDTYGYIALESPYYSTIVIQIILSNGTMNYATGFGVTYSYFRPMVINSVLYFYHSDSTNSITKMKYDFTIPDGV